MSLASVLSRSARSMAYRRTPRRGSALREGGGDAPAVDPVGAPG